MILMPFAPQIIVGDETLTLRRYNNNLNDPFGVQLLNGKRVLGEFKEYSIACNVQPVTGDDVVLEAEGTRYNDQYYIWVWDTSEKPQPNDLVLRTDWYQVMAATDWGSYCQARLQRIDVGPMRYMGF